MSYPAERDLKQIAVSMIAANTQRVLICLLFMCCVVCALRRVKVIGARLLLVDLRPVVLAMMHVGEPTFRLQ